MGEKRFDGMTATGLPPARQDKAAVELIAVRKVYASGAGEPTGKATVNLEIKPL